MGVLRRFAPQTITAQITCLVIAAVLLGVGLASAVLLYWLYNGQATASSELAAAGRAARIAAVVREAEATQSPGELDSLVKASRRRGVDVERVPTAGLASARNGVAHNPAFVRAVRATLQDTWRIVPIPDPTLSGDSDSIVVRINDESALNFEESPRLALHRLVLVQTICALAVIVFIILFLSVYAVRWITSPLSSIAAAARSFGRSSAEHGTLSTTGPREIAQVAEALNDMRKRVRSLVDERTQMLVAISHDLRTPLTRLRLRAERLDDANLRIAMLQDIAMVNDMLGETLAYLREGGPLEPVHLVDLPSLLQTICAQFADVGHAVSYAGPDRFAFACRAHALSRAVTNVVDNGTKHGDTVELALRVLDDGTAEIDVSDDGPGIRPSLRDKVFEPFFKGDGARPSSGRGGFGLGLSIARDIVRRDGGTIALLDRAPRGLTVRLSVAGQPATKIRDFEAAAGA